MVARRDPSEQIDFVLRRHFSATFTSAQRAAVVAVIREWDCQQEQMSLAERQRHWLRIAREAIAPRQYGECAKVGG